MSSQVSDLRGTELEAWINFLRAHAAVTRQFNAELLALHGLTINDYDVLAQLSRHHVEAIRSARGLVRSLDALLKRAQPAEDGASAPPHQAATPPSGTPRPKR